MTGLREITWAPFNRLQKYIRKAEEIFAGYPLIRGHLTDILRKYQFDKDNTAPSGHAIVAMSRMFDLTNLKPLVDLVSVEEFVRRGVFQSPDDVYVVRDEVQYHFRYADSIPEGNSSMLIDDLFTNFTDALIKDPEAYKNTVNYLQITKLEHAQEPIETSSQLVSHRKSGLHDFSALNSDSGIKKSVHRIELGKFHHVVNLEAPLPADKPLLIIGTTFGSHRLLLNKPESRRLQEQIRDGMLYSNPVLESVVSRIVSRIGGEGSYIGIHLRVGDGYFEAKAQETVQNMASMLMKQQSEDMDFRERLQRPIHVFLSTDADNPANSSLLEPLRDQVDRIWTLSEFSKELLDLNQLEELKRPDPSLALTRILDRLMNKDLYLEVTDMVEPQESDIGEYSFTISTTQFIR